MLRKSIGAAALAALFASAAQAQLTGPIANTGQDDRYYWNAWPIVGRERTPEDAGREIQIERQYRETLKTKIPDKKPSNDPWRSVRQAPAAMPADRHRVQ